MNAPSPSLTLDPAAEPGRVKPKLRGVSHLVGAAFALAGTGWLLKQAHTPRAWWAALMYGASLVLMLAVSGLYHTPYWAEAPRSWWRRADHATVFVLIAGCYTIWCRLAMPEEHGNLLFRIVWISCALGVLRALFWTHAPRWIIAGLYVVIGWAMVPWLGVIHRTVGSGGVWWAFAGGLIYTLAAVVYARKWPNPWPRVFGYHEVMHLIVLAAAGVHFAYIQHLVASAR